MHVYHWDFRFLLDNAGYLAEGLVGMAKLAVGAIVLGAVLGLVVGICRISRLRPVRWTAIAYISLFRNTPALVQLLWLYYALPILTGLQIGPFVASLVAFTLSTAAYAAEIFRAGIGSVGQGQWEAAQALGLGYLRQMQLIVLPQAIRRMIPAFTNQAIDVVKLTAISSMIAYGDLVYHAKMLAEQEFRPIESYTMLALLFSAILIPLSYFALMIERRFARSR